MSEEVRRTSVRLLSDARLERGFIMDRLADFNDLLRQLTGKPGMLTYGKLEVILNQPNFFLLVLIDDDRDGMPIVGMASIDFTDMMNKVRATVEDVIVDDHYRGQGLGGKLLDAMMIIARARQATSIVLTSNPVRTAAHKLYESRGFVKRDTNVFVLKIA